MRAAACMMGIARPRPSAVRAPTAEQTDAGRVTSPSGLFLVEELCRLLCAAAGIIQRQAALLEMHGIRTADGALENEQQDALDAIREMAGEDAERCVLWADRPGRPDGVPTMRKGREKQCGR